MCGIYLIQNIIDGKIYIGQAVDIGLRWSSHLSLLQAGKHPSKYLQEAVNKFGIDNFTTKRVIDVTNIPKSKILASRAFLTFSFITPPTNIKSGPKFPLLSYMYYIILFLNYKHLF